MKYLQAKGDYSTVYNFPVKGFNYAVSDEDYQSYLNSSKVQEPKPSEFMKSMRRLPSWLPIRDAIPEKDYAEFLTAINTQSWDVVQEMFDEVIESIERTPLEPSVQARTAWQSKADEHGIPLKLGSEKSG